MKNIIKVMTVLLLFTAISCSKGVETEDNDAAVIENTAQSAAVTFIELGSVSCVPCKMMQPIMDAVEVDFGDEVDVVFHDVWTEAGKPYALKYKINAIPTQIFLDNEGNEYYRHAGFFPKDELYKILEQGLALD